MSTVMTATVPLVRSTSAIRSVVVKRRHYPSSVPHVSHNSGGPEVEAGRWQVVWAGGAVRLTTMPLESCTALSRYEIASFLAAGGRGAVHRAPEVDPNPWTAQRPS